jgi:hypothetical protein
MQWRRDSVIIDPEPRSLVPPLTAGERAGLEESLKGGPDGRQVLLDGRRRYEICGRLGISCRVAVRQRCATGTRRASGSSKTKFPGEISRDGGELNRRRGSGSCG